MIIVHHSTYREEYGGGKSNKWCIQSSCPFPKRKRNSTLKTKRGGGGGGEKKTVEKPQEGALIQDQTIKYDCEKHNNGGYKHCMNLWC